MPGVLRGARLTGEVPQVGPRAVSAPVRGQTRSCAAMSNPCSWNVRTEGGGGDFLSVVSPCAKLCSERLLRRQRRQDRRDARSAASGRPYRRCSDLHICAATADNPDGQLCLERLMAQPFKLDLLIEQLRVGRPSRATRPCRGSSPVGKSPSKDHSSPTALNTAHRCHKRRKHLQWEVASGHDQP